MATNNIPTVNVNLDSISRKIKDDEKAIKLRKQAASQIVIPDSVDVTPPADASVASHAEGQAPRANKTKSSSHSTLVGAREKLEKKFEESCFKATPKDIE